MNKKIPIIIGVVILIIMVGTIYFVQTGSKVTINETASNVTARFNQTAMLERGDVAMGFDQSKIQHHFMATPTGGQIMIVSLNMSDIKTISEIKSHVQVIQYEFSQGNFTKPFYIHDQVVPGTEVMTAKKNLIQYSIKDVDNGSILILTTNDAELLDAIPQFMNFQSGQHMGH
ncbi:MAG: hypothetical protein HZA84_00905 [Thaumarchaeota archaeon]|nr:hypothetical protein [Nitrososphaerota archaeon]